MAGLRFERFSTRLRRGRFRGSDDSKCLPRALQTVGDAATILSHVGKVLSRPYYVGRMQVSNELLASMNQLRRGLEQLPSLCVSARETRSVVHLGDRNLYGRVRKTVYVFGPTGRGSERLRSAEPLAKREVSERT